MFFNVNILVTGGAGFIGSHVCDALLARGERVICIDNFNDYYSPNRKKKNIAHNLNHPHFKLYYLDVTDKKRLKEVFIHEQVDKIIHIAAKAGVRHSLINPQEFQEDNNKATMNLLELAKDFKVQNFIFASSSSVYGNNTKVPFSEDDNVDYPISPYAATKKSCELMIHTFSHIHGLNATCLRFFTVYGPRGRPDMVPYQFTKSVLEGKPIVKYGDGSTARDYTYISDIVKGILAALDKNLRFEIINLGNSSPVKLNDFISIVEKHTGKTAQIIEQKIPPGDVLITCADISKAQRLLEYNPQVNLDEGMKMFIEWFKGESDV